MKNSFKFLGLSLVCLLMSGCYTYNIEQTINKDKSMEFKMEMGMDLTEYKDMLGDDYNLDEMSESADMLDEEDQKVLKEQGYEVKATKEDYKTTISVSKKFKSIDDVTNTKEKTKEVDMSKFGQKDFDEVFFTKSGNKYVANLVFDFSNMSSDDMDGAAMDDAAMKDAFKMEYKLNLPVKATKHNATSTENKDKTLIWKLEVGKKNVVTYEFELEKGSNTALIVGIAVAAVAVCAVAFVLVNKKKNPKNNEEKVA